MPMKVDLKFPELPPAATATIASGVSRLAAVREALAPFKSSAECAALLAAVGTLSACIAFAQKTESDARGLLSNYRDAVEQAADLAASKVAADGYSDRKQYTDAVERERSDVAERFGATAWQNVLEAKQAEAVKLAAAAVAAMRAGKKALDLEAAKQSGPLALREQMSMEDLATLAAIRTEEEAKRPSEWLSTLEALIAGDDERGERLYTLATKLVANEVVSLTAPKLAERLGITTVDNAKRRDVVERERAAALRYLDRLAERAEELTPESVKLATLALQELSGVFCALLGYHAMVVSREAFDRRRQSGRADPLDVSEGWPMRLGLAATAAKGKR